MRRELFLPSSEGEARLLLLISAFSREEGCLEGRTKLAKLDFLLRYPKFFRRALEIRGGGKKALEAVEAKEDIEGGMVRFRYGPWDPAYYALLGRLIGKQLIIAVPYSNGVGYKASQLGLAQADRLASHPEWKNIRDRTEILKSKFDIQGSALMRFIYQHFPEVSKASIGEVL